MGEARSVRSELALELSRRDFMRNASVLGLGALVMSALPVAELIAPDNALADVGLEEATMQAFADTILPGRKALKTDLGDEIHPLAIAGVDPEPGAVEADVMRLYHHPLTGFDALQAPFLTDLNTRALSQQGAPFLSLSFDKRVAVLEPALAYGSSERVLFEAAAAVPFTAFCAAAVHPVGTDRNASGYRVMGYPGAAPNGYQRTFSYRKRLARERTKKGYLN